MQSNSRSHRIQLVESGICGSAFEVGDIALVNSRSGRHLPLSEVLCPSSFGKLTPETRVRSESLELGHSRRTLCASFLFDFAHEALELGRHMGSRVRS